ncbi:hypothetical protein L7F22_035019 [Adiantum nelumboides]|nr:hypothetical protein [Adiantum nelumboides]
MMEQRQKESHNTRMKRQILTLEGELLKLQFQMPLLGLQEGRQQRELRGELIDQEGAKKEKILLMQAGDPRQGEMGPARVKHRYHMERVIESEFDSGNGTKESDHSRWRMGTGKASRRKERSLGHKSRSLDGHYRKDRDPDLKIACPIFKGKKHDDTDVHIQAFEQYAKLKHILEDEWGEYFPHTLKEAARVWYYHYPASKLQTYKKLKKVFILEYTNDRGDEDILCELDKIKQGKLSVKKYVQKIKELTRRLNEPPSEKRMRAWFLSGFNNRNFKEQEVPTPTKKFIELVHRALKLEQQAKKEKSRHRSRSESNTSESTETEKSNRSSIIRG